MVDAVVVDVVVVVVVDDVFFTKLDEDDDGIIVEVGVGNAFEDEIDDDCFRGRTWMTVEVRWCCLVVATPPPKPALLEQSL